MNLATEFGEVGTSIEKRLKEHAEAISDHRLRFADQQNQLGAMNISLNAVRSEVLLRIELSELNVLRALAELDKKLGALLRRGENGHG